MRIRFDRVPESSTTHFNADVNNSCTREHATCYIIIRRLCNNLRLLWFPSQWFRNHFHYDKLNTCTRALVLHFVMSSMKCWCHVIFRGFGCIGSPRYSAPSPILSSSLCLLLYSYFILFEIGICIDSADVRTVIGSVQLQFALWNSEYVDSPFSHFH